MLPKHRAGETADVGAAETPKAVENGRDEQVATPDQLPSQPASDAVADSHDRWRRALADLDNLRKRYARDLERERAAERDRVAAAWLPVLDHLELALEHAEADPKSILAGVRAVRDQAVEVLARLGYPRQDEDDVPFDPTRHEVVAVREDPDAAPNTVLQVSRPGYGVGDRLLRPTAVTVNARRE